MFFNVLKVRMQKRKEGRGANQLQRQNIKYENEKKRYTFRKRVKKGKQLAFNKDVFSLKLAYIFYRIESEDAKEKGRQRNKLVVKNRILSIKMKKRGIPLGRE